MSDHWWWRPGWQVGTRSYSWHVTLDGQSALHRVMGTYADALGAFPTLDVVPERWRHITMQGLGHVEDVSDDRRDAAVQAVAERLSALAPFETTFQHARVGREAIALLPADLASFTRLRAAVREGIADAWGSCPENADGFRAHTSVAYSNGETPTALIREALDRVEPTKPVSARFAEVSLIRMHRDRRMYEWETVARVRSESKGQSANRGHTG